MNFLRFRDYFLPPRLGNLRLQPEQALNTAIANDLRGLMFESRLDCVFIHIANEHKCSIITGKILSNMGKLAGVPDLMFFKKGYICFMEVKCDGKTYGKNKNYLKANQKRFKELCAMLEVPFYVVHSIEETRDALKKEGLLQ